MNTIKFKFDGFTFRFAGRNLTPYFWEWEFHHDSYSNRSYPSDADVRAEEVRNMFPELILVGNI
jgi:hypothetical protein